MKLLIVDDETPARARLRQLVMEIPGWDIGGEAANGHEALLLVERTRPDALLLDIRMPVMDGLEAARHLAELDKPPAIIFTTAYDRYAMEAFDVHATAYLMKPVRRERLQAALEHARQPNRAQLRSLGQHLHERRRHICARVRGQLQLVPVEDVLYFRADQKYVTVRYGRGEVLIEESLKALEEEFGDLFIRIHRNALVAADRIEGLEKDGQGHAALKLRGSDEALEVSRRLVAEVRKKLRQL